MINSAPALGPEENKNWSPRNCSAVIGWLGWKARHLTTISRVQCETRLISPTSVPIAKKFWLEAICSISWPRFISWEFDHFSSLKFSHLFEKKGPMKIWNHQNAKSNLSTIRPQFQILVLLEVNLGLKGFNYELSSYKSRSKILKASLQPQYQVMRADTWSIV